MSGDLASVLQDLCYCGNSTCRYCGYARQAREMQAEVGRLRAERDDLRTMVDFPEVVAGYAGPDGSTCMKVIGNDEKEYLRRSWKNAITQWQWWHQRYVAATGDTRGRTQIEMAERIKGGSL